MTPSFANSWPWLFNTLNNAKVDNLTLRDALLDELRKQAGKQTKPKKTYAPTGPLHMSPYGGSQRIIKHQSLAAVALSRPPAINRTSRARRGGHGCETEHGI
jgi:hypothetical protein